MNTPKSLGIGMVVMTAAAGGAYYFAKVKNKDEQIKRYEEQKRRAQYYAQLEQGNYQASGNDSAGSPSSEGNVDPAPTRHTPDGKGRIEKSKYEASEPYVSRKGDRFS